MWILSDDPECEHVLTKLGVSYSKHRGIVKNKEMPAYKPDSITELQLKKLKRSLRGCTIIH